MARHVCATVEVSVDKLYWASWTVDIAPGTLSFTFRLAHHTINLHDVGTDNLPTPCTSLSLEGHNKADNHSLPQHG